MTNRRIGDNNGGCGDTVGGQYRCGGGLHLVIMMMVVETQLVVNICGGALHFVIVMVVVEKT